MCLSETWCTEGITLPAWTADFAVVQTYASKKKNKGHARGGIIILLDKNIYKFTLIDQNQDFIAVKITNTNANLQFILITVYLGPSIDFNTAIGNLNSYIALILKHYPHIPLYIGGDFNSRVGSLNSLQKYVLGNSDNAQETRVSLDPVINGRGRKIIESFENNSMIILNGRYPGDYPGQFTYHGERGFTVIDLAACSWAHLDTVLDFKVMDIVTGSDHMPICVDLNVSLNSNLPGDGGLPGQLRFAWNRDLKDNFITQMKHSRAVAWFPGTVDQLSTNLIDTIKEKALRSGMAKQISTSRKLPNRKPWYDSECRGAKKKARAALKDAKAKQFIEPSKSRYSSLKNAYKELLEKKKVEYAKNLTNQLAETRNSKMFWQVINLFRKRSFKANPIAGITWQRFLENVYPCRQSIELTMYDVRHPMLDSTITREEIVASLRKCKVGKSAGPDGIGNESFKDLPSNWLLYLECLFNKILDTEFTKKGTPKTQPIIDASH